MHLLYVWLIVKFQTNLSSYKQKSTFKISYTLYRHIEGRKSFLLQTAGLCKRSVCVRNYSPPDTIIAENRLNIILPALPGFLLALDTVVIYICTYCIYKVNEVSSEKNVTSKPCHVWGFWRIPRLLGKRKKTKLSQNFFCSKIFRFAKKQMKFDPVVSRDIWNVAANHVFQWTTFNLCFPFIRFCHECGRQIHTVPKRILNFMFHICEAGGAVLFYSLRHLAMDFMPIMMQILCEMLGQEHHEHG